MRIPRLVITVAVLASLAGMAASQTSPPPVARALHKAAPVMDLIPAEAMGFVLVNDIKQAATAAEKFLSATGISEMIGMPAEEPWVVDMLKAQTMLGDGFNPSAGFAVVLLDPQQFDVDLAAMLNPAAASTQPASKLPVVILVPGTSIQELFCNYAIEKSGDYSVVALRMGPMLAAETGDYVALSPTAEALSAILSSGQKLSAQLAPDQRADIDQSDLSVHVNMKIAGPILAGMMESLQEMVASQAKKGPDRLQAEMFSMYMGAYGDALLQMDALNANVKFSKDGLRLGWRAAFVPESEWGQAIAEYKPVKSAKLLSRLPGLPYALAYGGAWEGSPQKIKQLATKMINKMFATKLLAVLPEETKSSIVRLTEKSYDQTSSFEIYLGGAPAGSGLVAMSALTGFQDATQGRAMIKELVPVYKTVLKAVTSEDKVEELDELEITYLDEAESIGDVKVDVVEVNFSGLAKMSEKEKADLQTVLGEQGLRARIASADNKTVAVTFGGGKAMLAESIKAAKAGNNILGTDAVKASLKHMPSNPMVLCLFDAANTMDLVEKAAKATSPESQPFPYRITTHQPVAMAAGISGSDVITRMYVPSALVQQAIKFANSMAEMKMTPQTEPAGSKRKDTDF